MGKAVVSTRYVHARELLADGVGCLIERNTPDAIAGAVNALLDDPRALMATKLKAYQRGRRTVWPLFAKASAGLIRSAVAPSARPVSPRVVPGLSAFFSMSDATGMLQHSVGIVPDRRHGYCLDDNARALMLMNVATALGEAERMRWSLCYASFIQYAWNPDKGRFRNFMNFDRTWHEDEGQRIPMAAPCGLWATASSMPPCRHPPMGRGPVRCRDRADRAIACPRAMGFAALGALCLLRSGAQHRQARAMVEDCCTTLAHLVDEARRPDWAWFEAVLGYDNPRLCQVLIEGGLALGNREWVGRGLETLDWINTCQTGAQGHFRPSVRKASGGTAHGNLSTSSRWKHRPPSMPRTAPSSPRATAAMWIRRVRSTNGSSAPMTAAWCWPIWPRGVAATA
jgi:hypothetical protein